MPLQPSRRRYRRVSLWRNGGEDGGRTRRGLGGGTRSCSDRRLRSACPASGGSDLCRFSRSLTMPSKSRAPSAHARSASSCATPKLLTPMWRTAPRARSAHSARQLSSRVRGCSGGRGCDFMIRTEATTKIALCFCSFHLRFSS